MRVLLTEGGHEATATVATAVANAALVNTCAPLGQLWASTWHSRRGATVGRVTQFAAVTDLNGERSPDKMQDAERIQRVFRAAPTGDRWRRRLTGKYTQNPRLLF